MPALVEEDTIIAAVPSFADVAEAERARRIAAASASIEAYVGRPLLRGTYTETHRPGPTRVVYLRATPVVSVSSVAVGHPATALDASAYWLRDADEGVLELAASYPAGYRWPDRAYGGSPRAGGVTVEYVGGWELEDMPADVVDAVIHAVVARGATVALSGGGIYASEQLGEYSYRISSSDTNSSVAAGLPSSVTGPLRRYRRVRFS
jgi:hypothetical protein